MPATRLRTSETGEGRAISTAGHVLMYGIIDLFVTWLCIIHQYWNQFGESHAGTTKFWQYELVQQRTSSLRVHKYTVALLSTQIVHYLVCVHTVPYNWTILTKEYEHNRL